MVGNVGDSRAVLATRDEDDSLIAVQLTVDLKPSVPGTKLGSLRGCLLCLSLQKKKRKKEVISTMLLQACVLKTFI